MNLCGKRLHFMGIGGIGVSALAEMAKAEGATVSGCDRSENECTRSLAAKGIEVVIGHDSGHAAEADLLVYTSAVGPDHPERRAAGGRQERRGQFLARLMEGRRGIGVSGTHGKTTVSWLLAHLFISAGEDPAVFIGGVVPGLAGGNHRLGTGRFIAELDESDESFLLPRLDVAVATNLESDHLSHYRDFGALRAAFRRYAGGVAEDGLFVSGADSPELVPLFNAHEGRKISFGLSPGADAVATDMESGRAGSSFGLRFRGRDLGRFRLSLPGAHNVQNALAALATALETGLDAEALRRALPLAAGVGRRLEFLGEVAGASVYSDYAHHPTEVAASLAALRLACPGRLLAVFQPHLFSRTRDYADAFGAALAGADAVVLADIYPAREEPIPGVTSDLIAAAVRRGGTEAAGPFPLPDAGREARARLPDFDVAVFMGAGDIDGVARLVGGVGRAGG